MVWVAMLFKFFHSPRQHPKLSAEEREYIESNQEAHLAASGEKPKFTSLLKQRNTWGIAIPRMLADPTWGTLNFWMPLYLATERGKAGSSIETIGDAVWWAFVTIATVGYGDMVPVTMAGRVIGIVLMVVGLALVAIITASVASWFVANSRGEDVEGITARDAEDRHRIMELERKLDVLLEAHLKREENEDKPG